LNPALESPFAAGQRDVVNDCAGLQQEVAEPDRGAANRLGVLLSGMNNKGFARGIDGWIGRD